MNLSWQKGFSLSRKPVKRSTARRSKQKVWENADGPQQFEFVAEHPLQDPGATRPPTVIAYTDSGASVEATANRQGSYDPSGITLSLANHSKNKHTVLSDKSGPNSHEAIDRTRPSVPRCGQSLAV